MLEPATAFPRRASGRRRAKVPSTCARRSPATASRSSASTRSTGRRPERTSCLLLRDRRADLAAAGIRPSRSRATRRGRTRPGRRRSGVEDVPLLSDWNGEATRGFGVAVRARRDGRRLRAQRVPDRGRYGQGRVDARERPAGRRRRDRGGFVALALALYAACAVWATWPAVRHIDGHYLARPAAGHGEAAAGDHLQLGWAFWLPGHQLEQGAAPWADPYSFRPEADAAPNLQGWLLGAPFWPLRHLLGNVWAYNLIVLLSFVAAGGSPAGGCARSGSCAPRPSSAGSCSRSRPYRVGQSTGHLLGLIAFLLPAMLLALERRRFVWAGARARRDPALGADPPGDGRRRPRARLRLGARAARPTGGRRARRWRSPRRRRSRSSRSSSPARSQRRPLLRPGASATPPSSSDFVTRGVGAGIEEFVFLGWLTPLVGARRAVGGPAPARARLASSASAAVVPVPARARRQPAALRAALAGRCRRSASPACPERLLPIACLALAALVALALDLVLTSRHKVGATPGLVAAVVAVALVACSRSTCTCRCSAPSQPTGRTRRTRRSAATGACSSCRSSGPTSISAPSTSPTRASRPASGRRATRRPRRRRPTGSHGRCAALSCGRGIVPAALGVRFVVVHRGLYAQSGFFAPGCAAAAEAPCAGTAGGCSRATARSRPGSAPEARRLTVGYGQRTMAARDRLPRGDPQRERLRRRGRDAAAGGAAALRATRQPAAAEARGPSARLLVQAPRRLQQDVAAPAGRAAARGRGRVGRQPRPGRRARGQRLGRRRRS